MRHYDTKTMTETHAKNKTTIPENDDRVKEYFQPLKEGRKIYMNKEDGLPYFYNEYDDIQSPTVVDGVVVDSLSKEEKDRKKKQKLYQKVQEIFTSHSSDIKAIAIDKTGSTKYIQEQYEAYEAMYTAAKAGQFEPATNKAIMEANEAGKALVANITLAMNTLRSHLTKAIENGVDVSEKLEILGALKLTRESCTLEAIEAFMTEFNK